MPGTHLGSTQHDTQPEPESLTSPERQACDYVVVHLYSHIVIAILIGGEKKLNLQASLREITKHVQMRGFCIHPRRMAAQWRARTLHFFFWHLRVHYLGRKRGLVPELSDGASGSIRQQLIMSPSVEAPARNT